VLARVNNDVLRIDLGGAEDDDDQSPLLSVRLFKNGDLTPGLMIRRVVGGLKYEVCDLSLALLLDDSNAVQCFIVCVCVRVCVCV
jgi:hypothetical protein